MPLIRDEGLAEHSWHFVDEEKLIGRIVPMIVPLARFNDILEDHSGLPIGVAVANDSDVGVIKPHFGAIDLITVDFPSFADGRGFSLAQRLCDLGFAGELWARGHVIPDQYAFARSCGFDAVLVDDEIFARQGEADWRAAATSLSLRYQKNNSDWRGGPRSIRELRRSGQLQVLPSERGRMHLS
jgi:uncharacterized protein (DUF934 family)